MSIDLPDKLPLFVRRAVEVYNAMMRVLKRRCHTVKHDAAGNEIGRRTTVMPEMTPGEKRAFDAAGFIMKTYYELKLLEQGTVGVHFEELMEFSPEEQALVAEDPDKMFSIYDKRKKEKLKALGNDQ